MVGETGDIIARAGAPAAGARPACADRRGAGAALSPAASGGERRAAGVPLAIAAAAVGIPVLLALASPGKDYVLARNLMPALVPLLVAVAFAVTLRGARRRGPVLGAALFAYSLGFCVWASLSPALQRPDWGAVAAKLGEPAAPRAIVTWTLGRPRFATTSRPAPSRPRRPTASTGSSTRSTSSPTARPRRCRPGCSARGSARWATNRRAAST